MQDVCCMPCGLASAVLADMILLVVKKDKHIDKDIFVHKTLYYGDSYDGVQMCRHIWRRLQ